MALPGVNLDSLRLVEIDTLATICDPLGQTCEKIKADHTSMDACKGVGGRDSTPGIQSPAAVRLISGAQGMIKEKASDDVRGFTLRTKCS